jgi:type VI secretion system protein ImpL
MNIYLVTGAALLLYLILVWFLGNLLGLHGRDLWVLRIGLAIIGVIGAGVFLWFKRKEQKEAAREGSPEAAGPAHEEVDALIRDAEAKLAAARIEGGAKLGNLPAIFLIGEAGATKTSTMIHSGLEPELIAGQVFQDTTVVPTRSANFWYARRSIFVEAAGKLLGDSAGWQRLVRRLRPGKLGAVVGKNQQAPRAALVCFDCETFVRAGSGDAVVGASRSLHARLAEISQALGINLPVYVLFTRTDRLPFFNEYVRNLSNEEATQVLGVTLPMAARSSGVYAEQEGQRLTGAFNDLYYSLCDKRPEFLSREHDAEKLPGIYEFPREFRKLRSSMAQFLVDLARPSQLTTGPFLRGFYFSGVRPIVVNEVAPAAVAPRSQERQGFEASREATGFFRMGQGQQPAAPPVAAQVRGGKRVPQWCFIGHLFSDVVLEDKVALGASAASTQANTLRRVLLATAAALGLIFAIGFLVSYSNNRELESEAVHAAAGIPSVEIGVGNLATLEALQKLEILRQKLEILTTYEREGAPWSLRWGLYNGHTLYPDLRRVYFKRFRQLLFGQVQSTLLASLQQLPPTPGPAYSPTYQTLKAYLITTSNHDKSTRMFLSPLLLDRWSAGRNVEPERSQLAQKQFDFYAEELKAANPFSSENDTLAVERARTYLKRFSGVDSVYNYMLDEAGKTNRPVSFHQVFPAAAQAVVDRKVVPGAFTKGGWAFMQNAFKDPSRFFSGELWVMGEQGATGLGAAAVDELRKRYQADYIQHWREFVKSGAVLRYANLRDANDKLRLLSGSQSPLLQLFSLVSKNTAVGVPEVDNMFRASQSVVPPANADVPAGPSNQPYMTGLVGLQNSIDPLASQPGVTNDAAVAQVTSQEQAAKGKVGEMAFAFGNDPEATTVRQLLEAPITNVDPLLRGIGAQALNGAGRAFCAQYQALMRKYPFNPGSTEMADLPAVNAIFKPKDGELWKFYDTSLKNILPRQGARFVPGATPGFTISSRFVTFMEHAAGFSDALYGRGSADPRLEFSLRPSSPEVQLLRLNIEGQSFDFPGGAPTFRKFTWPGGVHEVKLSSKMKDGNEFSSPPSAYQGLWAVFAFFDDTENWRQAGSSNSLEWKLKVGRTGRVAASVQFELDMGGAPPIFQRGYLASLACVSEVAR